jgi:ubiquinone/menaquinone biosynthesis C-methylase UbiE
LPAVEREDLDVGLGERSGPGVTGVDFSAAQIARARALVPAARFVCADLRAVEFPDAYFDAICSYYASTQADV